MAHIVSIFIFISSMILGYLVGRRIISEYKSAKMLSVAADIITDQVNRLNRLAHLICLYRITSDLDDGSMSDETKSEELNDVNNFKRVLREHMEELNEQYKHFSLATCEPNMFNWMFKKKYSRTILAVEKFEETYNTIIADYDNFFKDFKTALDAETETGKIKQLKSVATRLVN